MMINDKITRVEGRCIPLRGNDIDTDRIIPARFLRCVTFDGLGKYAFEDDRKQDPRHSFDQPCYQGATILLAGKNFGCGSSREHAPQSLYRWGIRGIVGVSFAEIFFGNCNAMGMPCICVDDDAIEKLFRIAEDKPESQCSLDVANGTVLVDGLAVEGNIPEGVRNSFLTGTWNATNVLLNAEDSIEAKAAELPYIRGY